jgi:hypothetical protein
MSKLKLNQLVENVLSLRETWLRKLLDPRRDIEEECGHPKVLTTSDFKYAFERGDIAQRVVSVLPTESWAHDPEVYETEDAEETKFEKAWIALEKEQHIYSHLGRVDILSGIGRFGVLMLGLDDGGELSQPVGTITGRDKAERLSGEHKLLYLRPFDESLVRVNKIETDVHHPRYGQPTEYNIDFADTTLGIQADPAAVTSTVTKAVHWTRIIHICDNRTNSEVFGLPRMQVVFNRLLDLSKIAGGSGEMFWKGGFPGLSLESTPIDGVLPTIDVTATKEQMEAYMNGLQRYIATAGMQVKSLSTQIADPTAHMESQIRLIAMAIGVPWRILMGVEVGQLASEQDLSIWNRRLMRRREAYISPFVIAPLVDRLIQLAVLPELGEEGYQIYWPDLNAPSDEQKATVAEKRTNAISKYVQGGCDQLVDPQHYLTLVLGFTDEEAESIIEEVGDRMIETDPEAEAERELELAQAAARGNGNGTPAQSQPPGAPRATAPGGQRPQPAGR